MNSETPSVHSFSAVSNNDAQILVLGSMPGVASLEATQYYAHPRNAFWPIAMAAIKNDAPGDININDIPYDTRLQLLLDNQIALWDVLAECVRPGSLDSAIDKKTVAVNPIPQFLQDHTSIKRILFNGKAAEAMFTRHLLKGTNTAWTAQKIELRCMPSTSPAMAQLTLDQKYEVWKPALTL